LYDTDTSATDECTPDLSDSSSTESETFMEKPNPLFPSTFPATPHLIRTVNLKRSVEINIGLLTLNTHYKFNVQALLDSGATGLFINKDFVEKHGIETRRLPRAITVYNVDGTINESGLVREVVEFQLSYKNHKERSFFHVTNLGTSDVILGLPWLQKHNPSIDWTTGDVEMSRCPKTCGHKIAAARKARKDRARKKEPFPKIIDESEDDEEVFPTEWYRPGMETRWMWFEEEELDFPLNERIFFANPDNDQILEFEINKCKADELLSEYVEKTEFDDYPRPKSPKEFYVRKNSTTMDDPRHVPQPTPIVPIEELIPPHYHDFLKVFDEKASERFPEPKKWDHAIDLDESFIPQNSKTYQLSPEEDKELEKFLNDNLKKGYIRPSKSPQTAPFFFVPKPDASGLRPCQDYRYLNSHTVRNNYPLPLISELIDKLRGSKVFTKLDLRWGYNNLRIKEGDEWKAAFKTNRGSFEPTVMFFGLSNSPASFQTMMNEILKDLIDQGHVVVYMDDILIFTEDLESHRRITNEVLRLLEANDLFLKPQKCFFEKAEIKYLGLIISADGVKMDPKKVEGVLNWPRPTKVKELQAFLGFANFYRRFVKDFAKIASPLHGLTKKDIEWKWEDHHEAAFNDLKEKFTSEPILHYPDPKKELRIEADSSGFATGGVLSILEDDGKWYPCAYLSKGLSSVERNYDIHDKEMLSIMRCLEEWRHHLEGASLRFDIWSDHKNLEYFMTSKKLNRRQARWSLFLSRFHFLLRHRAGTASSKPDLLSRRADHNRGEDDNVDEILLKPEFFRPESFRVRANQLGHVLINAEEGPLLSSIRKSKKYDEAVVKAVEELRKSSSKHLRSKEWSEEQGLILFRGKVYVPKDVNIRRKLVQLHHDTTIAGHPGQWKTIELVSRNYWWPGMTKFIINYVKGCDACNRSKIFPQQPIGKLQPIPIPSVPWKSVASDFITHLPNSEGFNAILVVNCRYTKRAHFIPSHDETSSAGLAVQYRDNVWKHHGLPDEMISDRGPQFASSLMKELNKLLGIRTKLSTPYHPQTDGQTERTNQELEQYLRIFVNHRQSDWADWLPMAEFAYNNKIHSSTKQTPFFLDTGIHPRMGVEPIREPKHENAKEFATRMDSARKEAEAALSKAASEMKRYADHHKGEVPEYQVGQKVWLESSNYSTDRPTKKFSHRRLGPFPIIEVVSPNAVKLKLPFRLHIHPVVNVSNVRPFIEPIIPGQTSTPPDPVTIVGEETYEVEKILDSKLLRGKLHYLVKWKGYTAEHNSWEPERNLVPGSNRLIKEFHSAHPSAPRKINVSTFKTMEFKSIENLTEIKSVKKIVSDVVVYIKPEFIPAILDRSKNHEYRKYRLDRSVQRLWLFENAPTSAITTVLDIGFAKSPGEVNDSSGMGNDDFDKGLKQSKFGYPILAARQLKVPITRDIAVKHHGFDFPPSHFDAPSWLLSSYPLDSMQRIF
jgi:hypothetical protein